MSCKPSCRLCDKCVISQSITVVAVNGIDTLVVDLPSRAYMDGCKYCIIFAQSIPAEATIYMPVAFSIGGDTTTVYPFVKCNCSQITACGVRARTRYSTVVSTNTISGVFKSLGGTSCCPNNNLTSLPIEADTAAGAAIEPAVLRTTKIKTNTTKKEVNANE